MLKRTIAMSLEQKKEQEEEEPSSTKGELLNNVKKSTTALIHNKRWIVTKAFKFSAGTEEEILTTLPPSGNENDREMVRGREHSALSDNEDKVSFETLKQEWTVQSDQVNRH